jgi:hypothetical protein
MPEVKRPNLVGIFATLAVVSFALNIAWEMLQMPLYERLPEIPFAQSLQMCARASLGDAALSLVAYACVVLIRKSVTWLMRPHLLDLALFIAIGLVFTVTFEGVSVYVLNRWTYTSTMPVVFGVGAAPLAQWVIVPLLSVGLARLLLRASSAG